MILKLTYTNKLPTHLLLGSDAVQISQQAEKKREADAEVWHEVSISTDAGPSTSVFGQDI